MVKNSRLIKKFEKEYVQSHPPNIRQNFKIAESLYAEARALGILPNKNPLDGIEVPIRIAKALRSVSKPS